MAHSDRDVRERVAKAVKALEFVEAETLRDLKDQLGLADISNTKVSRALRSLQYNPAHQGMGVYFARFPFDGDPYTQKGYRVAYVGSSRLSA